MVQSIQERVTALSLEQQRLLALKLGLVAQVDNTANKTILSAFVTAKSDVEESALRNHLSKHLPKYMIPTHITILDELPRTPNGKVDRTALLNQHQPRNKTLVDDTYTHELDEIEKQLMELWSDLLGFEILDIHDDFFELGGYSLLAIRMLGRIKEIFGKDLPPSIILEASTIAKLANNIRDDTSNRAEQTIFTLQSEGEKPPIYYFQVHKYGVITYRYMAEHLGTERPVYGVALPQDIENKPDTIEELASIFVESLLAHHTPPFYLGGMSIAGLIAYETARQLQERGIHDVYVLLFDTYGPNYPQMIASRDALRQRAMVHFKQLVSSDIDKSWYLKELLWRNWYRATYQFGRVINRLLVQMSLKEPKASEDEEYIAGEPKREFMGKEIHGEMIELLELEEKYFLEQKPYSGNVILYRSTLQPLRASYNETLGWDKFIKGNITIRHVRGNHSGIMRYPFVNALAERVKEDLSKLDR